MRVLRTTPSFYPHVTGPAYQAYRISEGLVKRGHSSPLLTTDVVPEHEQPGYPPELGKEREFPFEVIRRKALFSVDQYWVAPTAVIDAVSIDYDIVHVHGFHNAIKDIIYLPSKLIRSKPLVIHLHGSLGGPSKDPTLERTLQYTLYDLLFWRTLENADAIIVSSELEKGEALQSGISEEKITVIPVGKEAGTYTSIEKASIKGELRILFVGRLAPRRNVEMLLRAGRHFKENDVNDIKIRIVGGEGKVSGATDEYLPELQQFVSESGLEDMVEFTGPLYGSDLVKEYRSADVFVNPSHYENFGQATLEAAFAGLPIIATKTGIAPEIVADGSNGYLIDGDADLVSAVSEYYDHDELQNRHGELSQSIALTRFTWDNIIDQYLAVYEEVL